MNYLTPDRETEVVHLIRALCTIAGDEETVADVLHKHAKNRDREDFYTLMAATVLYTYARCLPGPFDLDTSIPTHTTQGAPR